jgi:hypothetical protein
MYRHNDYYALRLSNDGYHKCGHYDQMRLLNFVNASA